MTSTASLFDLCPTTIPANPAMAVPFSGADYDETRDRVRLVRQIDCILAIVIVGDWWTLQRLVEVLRKKHPQVSFPENSVQAQLRNLRKVGYKVERRHIANGLFEYRVLNPNNPGVAMEMRKEAA